jgi:hypothetical protein
MEQKAHGFDVWAQLMIQLRLPSLFNLRSDPFERLSTKPATMSGGSSSTLCARPRASGRWAAPDEFPAVSAAAKPVHFLSNKVRSSNPPSSN